MPIASSPHQRIPLAPTSGESSALVGAVFKRPDALRFSTKLQFYNPIPDKTALMVFDTWTSVNDSLTQGYYSSWNFPGPGIPPATPTSPSPPTNPYPPANTPGTSTGATSIPLWNLTAQKGPIVQALQITIRTWNKKVNKTL